METLSLSEKQQTSTIVLKQWVKSKEAFFFLCKTLLYHIFMVNHVIPAVFSCLTEIYAEQVIIKELDKFLS